MILKLIFILHMISGAVIEVCDKKDIEYIKYALDIDARWFSKRFRGIFFTKGKENRLHINLDHIEYIEEKIIEVQEQPKNNQ